jgi:hypothetical protein
MHCGQISVALAATYGYRNRAADYVPQSGLPLTLLAAAAYPQSEEAQHTEGQAVTPAATGAASLQCG